MEPLDTIKDFGRTAKGLSRNPLGIIALFIVLIYGFAALLLIFSENLNTTHVTVSVLFIVLFPLIVLYTFYRLVTKHPGKLYAPSDYRNEQLFVDQIMMTRNTTEEMGQPDETEGREIDEGRGIESGDRAIEAAVAQTISRPSDHQLAEDLVFRQLEVEYGDQVERRVTPFDRIDLEFDGALRIDNKVYLIDVIFTNTSDLHRSTYNTPWKRTHEVIKLAHSQKAGLRISMLFIVVVDLEESDRLKLEDNLKGIFADNVGAEVRVYDFKGLKERFKMEVSK